MKDYKIDEFASDFADIIYAGTLTDERVRFQFRLVDRSIQHEDAVYFQPIVSVRKETVAKIARQYDECGQYLFHSGELKFVSE